MLLELLPYISYFNFTLWLLKQSILNFLFEILLLVLVLIIIIIIINIIIILIFFCKLCTIMIYIILSFFYLKRLIVDLIQLV